MNEQRRGEMIKAARFLRHPTERGHVPTGMLGVILHELPEDQTGPKRIYVRWDDGKTFYVFESEISTDVHSSSS